MTVNYSKFYLYYLNKLVDECIYTYHRSFGKNSIYANYSALTEEIVTNLKSPKFKVGDRVRIIKYKNIFRKFYAEQFSKEIFMVDSVLKTNAWTYKIKDLNE